MILLLSIGYVLVGLGFGAGVIVSEITEYSSHNFVSGISYSWRLLVFVSLWPLFIVMALVD